MKNYSIYNLSTGLIHTQGQSSVEDINEIVLNEGDGILEGEHDRATQKVVNGVAVSYTPDFWKKVRRSRNLLLTESDWTQVNDSPLSDTKKEEWAVYRQALRDLPTNNINATSIDDITFPTPPSE
jgi:hypothetical protein